MDRKALKDKTIVELLEMEARLKDKPQQRVLLLAVQKELENRGRSG